MVKMMGRKAWYKLPCFCCNSGKTKRQIKSQEEKDWRKDLTDEDIDDRIDAWHDDGGTNIDLYEYLGWTKDQFEVWFYTSKIVPHNQAHVLVQIPSQFKVKAIQILIRNYYA